VLLQALGEVTTARRVGDQPNLEREPLLQKEPAPAVIEAIGLWVQADVVVLIEAEALLRLRVNGGQALPQCPPLGGRASRPVDESQLEGLLIDTDDAGNVDARPDCCGTQRLQRVGFPQQLVGVATVILFCVIINKVISM